MRVLAQKRNPATCCSQMVYISDHWLRRNSILPDDKILPRIRHSKLRFVRCERTRTEVTQSDLLFYFRLLLGRLPLIALCAIPIAVIGLVVAFTLPPTYRASARILVEAPDIPSEMARSTVVTSSVRTIPDHSTRSHHAAVSLGFGRACWHS